MFCALESVTRAVSAVGAVLSVIIVVVVVYLRRGFAGWRAKCVRPSGRCAREKDALRGCGETRKPLCVRMCERARVRRCDVRDARIVVVVVITQNPKTPS